MEKYRVLVLVEGPHDRQRLSVMSSLFKHELLEFIPCETDMFTNPGYFENFDEKVKDLLNKEKTIDLHEINEICQICDTDGCYIPDSKVYSKASGNIEYKSDCIYCAQPQLLNTMRQRKRDNISKFLESDKIRIYYVSTNIDHAFDGVQNPNSNKKRDLALNMYRRYKDNPNLLLLELLNLGEKFESYSESWEFIKEGNNSLLRCSNLKFMVFKYKEYLKDDLLELINQN